MMNVAGVFPFSTEIWKTQSPDKLRGICDSIVLLFVMPS